jgi:hypothetical protein
MILLIMLLFSISWFTLCVLILFHLSHFAVARIVFDSFQLSYILMI